ncbi:MAG: hypothetical protein A3D31_08775 [Candidatus Fluviicola riflensis]|nr:MAG: hypothetical protein CHH17_06220 [Candidatus Fluviicola riflensis]OGS80030.1 MAG: hypothetical protein A3D31_08775 [Candidatus Fluviicola riflensis]OGS82545.1 MAG: hypothetical protein A2724_17720 [Fluviicola sp. RIFCSPHIGHO2_01_FULL_43_53]OGS88209.1 MAG: hypothetical protein A3E30_15155 [Fluviicola sp. RIFCSPHIGHO2_12_FULL_43_24]
MKRKKRSGLSFLKRVAVTVTVLWAAALIVFFSNPTWAKSQWNVAYNWLTDRTFKPKTKPVPCTEHETHAWQMVDSVEQYWAHSCDHGIAPLKFVRDIQPAIDSGKLVPIIPNELYQVDTMRYSFPFAIPETRALIDTIATRFQHKLTNTKLAGVRITVTSVLRTKSSVARLLRHNRNAIRNSAHLHGTTFDLSYATYDFERPIDAAEADYLKEILAQTLFELRREKKCWVTYELFQTCFHIVTR